MKPSGKQFFDIFIDLGLPVRYGGTMVRATASLIALFALISAPFVMIEGCGSDPFDIPCDPAIGCGGDGYICWKGPNNQNDCLPPCATTSDCPPTDFYGNPVSLTCFKGNCYRPDFPPDTTTNDAGDCGEGGGGGDGGKTSAICGDTCTPYPDGWSSMQAFWVGPVEKAPFYSEFHGKKALPRFNGRANLDADPAECDVCSCAESTGKCTELSSGIDVRAAMCGQAGSSLSFGGPTNWEGSCTNANSIPAAEKCPVGSSTLCAQSVTVGPLGPPVDESCAPITDKLPIAKARVYWPKWQTAAVGYDVPGCNASESCVPSIDLPSGFRSCIYQRGERECPASWNGDRSVVYEVTANKLGFIDGRDCTPCSCGAPVGSLCVGQFRVFEDAACSKLISADPITSIKGQCTDVLPPGKAVGSKEITGLTYIPGFCEVTGGKPIGEVIPDPDQAVTFCCTVTKS